MYETLYYNNQNGYGYGYANPMFPEPSKQPLMTQALTPEEMSILTDKGGAFSTKVTQEDMYKAYCTHKRNGKIVATANPDGTVTCPICGETFEFRELSKESVAEDVNKVIADMQSIKLTFLDMPIDVTRQFFPIIPLLSKLPQLAVMAANNWSKYENPSATEPSVQSPYGMGAYSQLVGGGAMMSPMMGYYGGAVPMGGAAVYPAGTMTPIGAQQPMYMDAYGRPIPQPPVAPPPATNNQAQAAMMMGGGNEFVAGGAAVYPTVAQPTMVTPQVMVTQPAGSPVVPPVTTAPAQPALAPTTYTPQPQVTVNVNSAQTDDNKNQQPQTPQAGAPVVDVTSFKV